MLRHFIKRGFTILELLVVIAIVGILAAAAVYVLNITRASNRDAKRLSDVSVIQASLTQYWLQKASYPQTNAVDLGKPGVGADKLTGNGFVAKNVDASPVYLLQVPIAPKAGEYYTYVGSSQGYTLRFTTERSSAYGKAGVWYAHSGGVDQDPTQK